jgi:hypothetical protein
VLGEVWRRMQWVCYAYCLMTNHYHLVVETQAGNLSKGMRQVNGVYTQRFNRGSRTRGLFLSRRLRPFWLSETFISWHWCGTWYSIQCGLIWSRVRRTGRGAAIALQSGRNQHRLENIGVHGHELLVDAISRVARDSPSFNF